MPSPFPGMDPYLENVELWSGVHAALIARIQDQLAQRLMPRYLVSFEERVYVTAEDDPAYRLVYPDVHFVEARRAATAGAANPGGAGGLAIAEPLRVTELLEQPVRELRLEVRDASDLSVVTVIEVLSPTNKVAGANGRHQFLRKRADIYASPAHWLEIDLLRAGVRTSQRSPTVTTAYQAFVSRCGPGRDDRLGDLWPIALTDRLPVIGVPLRDGDADAPLDLQAAVDLVYDRAGYAYRIDYAADPPPPAMAADDVGVVPVGYAGAAAGGVSGRGQTPICGPSRLEVQWPEPDERRPAWTP